MRLRLAVAWTAFAATLGLSARGSAQGPPPPPGATATTDPAPPPPSAAPTADPAAPEDPDDAPEPDDQLRAIGEPETDPSAHRYFPLNAALIYPIATNIGDPNRATNIDLGVLFTKIGYLYGLQTGILASVSQEMIGVQVGIGAITEGRTHGVQLAGAFALADAPFKGIQVAGIFGWSRFHFEGIEIAGIANQSRKHFAGLQVAGAVNVARKTLHGVQIAGLMNIGEVDGLQLAPINFAKEVKGLQLGLINIAGKVSGLQLGLINIAGDLKGEAVGLASLPREGGVHGAVWGSNSLYGNFGVKFASRYTYSILSGAFHSEDKKNGLPGDTDNMLGPGFTFGFYKQVFFPDFYVHADLGGYRLFLTEGAQRAHDEIYKARMIARYAIVNRFSLFVGAGAYLGLRGDGPTARFGPEFDAGLEL